VAADGDHRDRARARRQRAARIRQRRRQAGAAAHRARQRHEPAAAQLRGARPHSGEPGGRRYAAWGEALRFHTGSHEMRRRGGARAAPRCGRRLWTRARYIPAPQPATEEVALGSARQARSPAAHSQTNARPWSPSARQGRLRAGPGAPAEARAHPGALALEAGYEPALLAAGQPVGRAGRLLAVAQLQLHARAQRRRRRRLRPHDRAARRGRLRACAAAGAGCWLACARCWPASAGAAARRVRWPQADAGATSAARRCAQAVRALTAPQRTKGAAAAPPDRGARGVVARRVSLRQCTALRPAYSCHTTRLWRASCTSLALSTAAGFAHMPCEDTTRPPLLCTRRRRSMPAVKCGQETCWRTCSLQPPHAGYIAAVCDSEHPSVARQGPAGQQQPQQRCSRCPARLHGGTALTSARGRGS